MPAIGDPAIELGLGRVTKPIATCKKVRLKVTISIVKPTVHYPVFCDFCIDHWRFRITKLEDNWTGEAIFLDGRKFAHVSEGKLNDMPRIICTMTAGQTRSTPVPDVSIVCPTYCESDNLVDLVVQIHAAVCRSHLTEEIIVIDDDSPDQTSQICSQLAEAYPLQLVVRKNARGLSSAVIHGLNIARGGIFVVMDADLSHPPEKIPALVSAIAHEGAEFAVGSRYTAGGGTDEQWAASRRLLSRLGTWLARPLTSISDPMSGFFAMPRQAFHSVANELNPLGYKIGLEILVKLRCQTIAEVPIQFRPRRRGVSKLSLHEELRFLRHLCRLYGYGLKGSQ